jgi:hypothetical protein
MFRVSGIFQVVDQRKQKVFSLITRIQGARAMAGVVAGVGLVVTTVVLVLVVGLVAGIASGGQYW